MERREFLKASYYTGLASLATGASAAFGQTSQPAQLPGETAAAYAQRLARLEAGQATPSIQDTVVSRQLPGESDAAYQQRLARLRAAQVVQAHRGREFYELRRYAIESEDQKKGFDVFAAEAFIPALNRAGIEFVGVFHPTEGLGPIYVLLCHRSALGLSDLTMMLMRDEEFLAKGAAFLEAPASKPAYQRMDVQLMLAFEGMPQLERPVDNPDRIFQFRVYESPSVLTGLKKIEMFNEGEIAIFRKTGLHPVFFGLTFAGANMPNLTYMLGFENMAESKANWKRFLADPEWKALSAIPEYADDKILCGITNAYLKPASYSQI